ncbi:hypothetical protein Scep_023849 [Stephania cephalantha]|uniref:Uncharacterized protein n=1 Tax=Stephania cephalantha TaxID=152367 RepID=A0AAP0F4D7_9MAGN
MRERRPRERERGEGARGQQLRRRTRQNRTSADDALRATRRPRTAARLTAVAPVQWRANEETDARGARARVATARRGGAMTATTVSGTIGEGDVDPNSDADGFGMAVWLSSGADERQKKRADEQAGSSARAWARGNSVEQRRGGALPGRSIPDETTTVDKAL